MQLRVFTAQPRHQALARLGFTVLLRCPILSAHKLRRQRQYLGKLGAGALIIGPAQHAGDATNGIALALMGGALVCESVNIFSVRNTWGSALIKANQSTPLSSLDVYPDFTVAWNPRTKTAALELMLDIRL
jgi:hypothetical protein